MSASRFLCAILGELRKRNTAGVDALLRDTSTRTNLRMEIHANFGSPDEIIWGISLLEKSELTTSDSDAVVGGI